ncbi:hypothetical protein HaLaN_24868 [Haematococcus lacustris]|uniref:Uncharacterized protein n=1 Tax=Haematococcus lacustris TaxID=44745 RepID=A0A699ZW23_HAELA|nr:hypothetical protein HaLaN_24868 [Haematococcus lacustris]
MRLACCVGRVMQQCAADLDDRRDRGIAVVLAEGLLLQHPQLGAAVSMTPSEEACKLYIQWWPQSQGRLGRAQYRKLHSSRDNTTSRATKEVFTCCILSKLQVLEHACAPMLCTTLYSLPSVTTSVTCVKGTQCSHA